MKRTYKIVGALIVFLLIPSPVMALFSSVETLKGNVGLDSSVFFLGKTTVTGTSYGIPMEEIIDSPFIQNVRAFPLLNRSTITNLDSVFVLENIDIAKAHSLEQLLTIYGNQIREYKDVTITMEDGLFLLGIEQGVVSVSSVLPYAVTTILPLEIGGGSSSRFLLAATTTPLTMQCFGNYSVLTRLSASGTITVLDTQGKNLWSGNTTNTYLVFQRNEYSVRQFPSLFLFPLSTNVSLGPLSVSIKPAASDDVSINRLIKNVSNEARSLGGYSTAELMTTFANLDDFISATSYATNGAMFYCMQTIQ